MGFIDEIGRKVLNAGQKNIQMVKDFSESTKMNALIGDEEKKIKNVCLDKVGRFKAMRESGIGLTKQIV